VITTGVLSFDGLELDAGRHRLTATIVGKHPRSTGHLFGLDYVRLVGSATDDPSLVRHTQHASASFCFSNDSVDALNDGLVPASSADQAIPRLTWWDHYGTREWAHYRFDHPREVSSTSVYWFDDRDIKGACRSPASWRLLYRDGVDWKPVETDEEFGVELNRFNRVNFKPVTSTEFRVEVQLREGVSAGILEWQLE
jgi:hypothetical protein